MLSALFRNPTFRLLLVLVLAGLAIHRLLIKGMYYRSRALERSAIASKWLENGFSVVVVWPPHLDRSLVEGVQLALDEVNAGDTHGMTPNPARLRGKIHVAFVNEVKDRGAIAREIVKYPNILAVIGHELSENVVPASISYEHAGILFISPKSTDTLLTDHNFSYIFRLTPDDDDSTKFAADFALSKGWTNVGMFFGRNDHGVGASGWFSAHFKDVGGSLIYQRSYLQPINPDDAKNIDLRDLVADVRKEFPTGVQANLVADILPFAAKLLLDMYQMGMTIPVLATDKLDSSDVFHIASQMANVDEATRATNNLYVVSAVDPSSRAPKFQAFRQRFHAFHGDYPGYGATQGYEAFMLFVNAILASGSADPVVVATSLRTTTWHGLFGDFSFAPNGDILGRELSIKHMQNGKFQTVTSGEPK